MKICVIKDNFENGLMPRAWEMITDTQTDTMMNYTKHGYKFMDRVVFILGQLKPPVLGEKVLPDL